MSDMNFGEPSGGGFIDSHFDFSRCQRPDGSFYGTSGQCRKGSPVSAKEKADLQALASRGDKAAMKKLTELRGEGKIGKEPGFAPGAKAREVAKETRDASKDLKNRRGTVIGTSPRNMLIDNRTTFQKRLKDARSDQERKLLQKAIDGINKRLERE